MTITPQPTGASPTVASLRERREGGEDRRRDRRRPESDRLVRAVFYGPVILVAWLMWKVVQPFALEIGDVSETITVSSQAAMVETTRSDLGGVVTPTEIQNLPVLNRTLTASNASRSCAGRRRRCTAPTRAAA